MSLAAAKQLSEVFAVLKPDLSVDSVVVSPSIYEELDSRYDRFKKHVLVAEHHFEEDWPTWERHPAGDEIVLLLSGQAEMIIRDGEIDERISLTRAGSYVIIPKGTWHTARVSEPTRMLFVTPGEATENHPEPDFDSAPAV